MNHYENMSELLRRCLTSQSTQYITCIGCSDNTRSHSSGITEQNW